MTSPSVASPPTAASEVHRPPTTPASGRGRKGGGGASLRLAQSAKKLQQDISTISELIMDEEVMKIAADDKKQKHHQSLQLSAAELEGQNAALRSMLSKVKPWLSHEHVHGEVATAIQERLRAMRQVLSEPDSPTQRPAAAAAGHHSPDARAGPEQAGRDELFKGGFGGAAARRPVAR